MLRKEHPGHIEISPAEHRKEPYSNKSDFAEKGDPPKGDLKFGRLNRSRHGETDYWAQFSGMRLIERLAGFSGMEQRFQCPFQRPQASFHRKLVEPINEGVNHEG